MSDEIKFLIACALGAAVRVLRDNHGVSAKRKLAEVVSGFGVAYYFGQAAVVSWQLEPALASSLGFAIGLASMELMGVAITLVTTVVPEIIRAVLRARFGLRDKQ